MTDEEKELILQEIIRARGLNNLAINTSSVGHTYNPYATSAVQTRTGQSPAKHGKLYSLAEVQLVGGEMIAMTISAGPTLGAHLTKEMGNTGYLYLYNDVESLMLKADHVVAVKLTQLTKE